MALPVGHAERVEQQHEQTFADAEARERDRQHLGGATAGRNASTAPFGTETPRAWIAQYTAISTEAW